MSVTDLDKCAAHSRLSLRLRGIWVCNLSSSAWKLEAYAERGALITPASSSPSPLIWEIRSARRWMRTM